MGEATIKPAGSMTTLDLALEIERVYGVKVSRQAIRSWALRDADPLPRLYQGKTGQPHLYDWATFTHWWAREVERTERHSADGDIDRLDWHAAKTVSAREQAKRDILETARLEERYADVATMRATAEDRARHAVQALMAIPARLAPRLAILSDELAIHRLIDAELREVCAHIATAARLDLGVDDDEAA